MCWSSFGKSCRSIRMAASVDFGARLQTLRTQTPSGTSPAPPQSLAAPHPRRSWSRAGASAYAATSFGGVIRKEPQSPTNSDDYHSGSDESATDAEKANLARPASRSPTRPPRLWTTTSTAGVKTARDAAVQARSARQRFDFTPRALVVRLRRRPSADAGAHASRDGAGRHASASQRVSIFCAVSVPSCCDGAPPLQCLVAQVVACSSRCFRDFDRGRIDPRQRLCLCLHWRFHEPACATCISCVGSQRAVPVADVASAAVVVAV